MSLIHYHNLNFEFSAATYNWC